MSNNLKLNRNSLALNKFAQFFIRRGVLLSMAAVMALSQTAFAAVSENSPTSAASSPSAASSSVGVSNAQSLNDAANKSIQPQVYVADVNVDGNKIHKAGDTLTGTFVLYNYSDLDMPGVNYSIRLVGGLGNNSARTYDEVRGPTPVELKPKEKKTISFTYPLSKQLSGSGISIFIQSYASDGLDLGWKTSDPFEVAGDSSYLRVISSSVEVAGDEGSPTLPSSANSSDSKFYPTQSGAFIYQNKYPQKAFIQFILENKNKGTVSLTPALDISELHAPSALVYHAELKNRVVSVEASKRSNSIALDLPNFNWKPGVYKGIVSFKNMQGEDQADKIEFLYIVGGEQYNVSALSSDVTAAEKDAIVSLNMSYEGAPFDVRANGIEQSDLHPAVVSTVLFNERDEKIGENSETVNFIGEQSRNFNVQALSKAQAIRAEVSISKNGNVVKKYDFKLSPGYDAAHDAYKNDHNRALMYVVFGISAIGAIALIAMLAIYRRRLTYRRK
jgi:hypothetical protein